MANIDYVTSHQGQAHITTQNVIDLLAGLSGDVRGIKKFPQLYNGLSHEITDALTIQVKTGAALAGGSFFILEDAYDWLLDPGTVGYSRIDILFLVMYEDPDTSVQSCDFVYEVGNLYPNGTTGTAPDAPTGTNITATYPFLRMDMTDGSIVSVTDYSTPYLSNSSLVTTVNELVEQLEQDVGGTVEQVQTNTNEIAQMKVTFQNGVDTIVDAIERNGVTPSASTPSACADGIDDVATNKYNAGYSSGRSQGRKDVGTFQTAGSGTSIGQGACTYTVQNNTYYVFSIAINRNATLYYDNLGVVGGSIIGKAYKLNDNDSTPLLIVVLIKTTSTSLTVDTRYAGSSPNLLIKLGPAS